MKDRIEIFAGSAGLPLAKEICDYLGLELGKARITRFPNGEIHVKIEESIREADVFVVQPTSPPSSENIMELLIMLDTVKRASARRITAVIPFFGYARQDRKDQPRVPITAKLMANLITVAGANRVLTMDLHAPQIQGFFDIPVDELHGMPVILDYFRSKNLDDLVVVAPDVGGMQMALSFAKRLNAELALVDKRRSPCSGAEAVNVVGMVEGKTLLIPDDQIDTGGTLISAVKILMDRNPKEIYASCTHPVFSQDAIKRIEDSPVKEVVVTNTIPHPEIKGSGKIKVLSVAPLFGEAIMRIHEGESVSSLFV